MSMAADDTKGEEQLHDPEKQARIQITGSDGDPSSDGIAASNGYLPGAKVPLTRSQFWIVLFG